MVTKLGNRYTTNQNLLLSVFLVHWSPQRTIVLSFFYLLSFFLAVFVLGLFMYDFMWFTKLRAWAGIFGECAGVCGCVQVGEGVHRLVWVCKGVFLFLCVCRYVQVCTGMSGCMWVKTGLCGCKYAGECGCVRVCTGVHRCLCVCMQDEFSEYLLETWVLTSADFNTYPIRIFSSLFIFHCLWGQYQNCTLFVILEQHKCSSKAILALHS